MPTKNSTASGSLPDSPIQPEPGAIAPNSPFDFGAMFQFDPGASETAVVLHPLTAAEQVPVSGSNSDIATPPVATANTAASVPVTAGAGGTGTAGSLLLVAGLSHKTGPGLNDNVTRDPTIQGRVIDTAAFSTLTAALDGGAGTSLTGTVGANGQFTLGSAALAAMAGGTLADGSHSVKLTATDASGNTAVTTLAFQLRTVAPVLTAALANDTGSSASDGVTSNDSISGVVTSTGGVYALLGTLDNGKAAQNFTNAIGGNGAFVLSQSQIAAFGAIANGAHTVTLKAIDTGGNIATSTVPFTLQTTIAAPVLSLAASDQSGNATTTTASAITLLGTTTPGAVATLNGATATANKAGVFTFSNVAIGATGATQLSVTVTGAAGIANSGSITVTHASGGGINAVTEWDAITRQAITRDASAATVASRALAMESLAVYDAVAAINGTPGFLISLAPAPTANAQAAEVAAANAVLDTLYPSQAAAFDAQAATDLAAIANSAAKQAGIALGRQAAAAIVAARANDGSTVNTTFLGSTTIGQWQPTAPSYTPAITPQWANVTPFALLNDNQFLPAAPPAIGSAAYAASVNLTESLGALNSTARTADQTQAALFWNDQTGTDTPAGEWNNIAVTVATAAGWSASAIAGLLAELNVAEADAAIAAWNGKFTYNAWRPITAIQNAAATGNSGIIANASWQPLIATPQFPEYPEGHGTLSGAAATVLGAIFGDNTSFTVGSQSLANVTRSFTSFSQAANEAAMSRIYGGIHFDFSATAAVLLGDQVGQWVVNAFNKGLATTPPTVTLTIPTNTVTNQDPTITGTVSTAFGVAALMASVNGGAPVSVPLSSNGSFSYFVGLALDGTQDGPRHVSFSAIDPAGNKSQAATYNFTLIGTAPVLTLAADSIQPGGTIGANGLLDGSYALESGDTLTGLSYTIDGGAPMSLAVDPMSNAFNQAIGVANLTPGAHTLVLTARDAAGFSTGKTIGFTYALPPLTLTSITPIIGTSGVGVTTRPEITFSRAVNPSTLTSADFFATDSTGTVISATIAPLADGTGAYLLFNNPAPGASAITLHVVGSGIKAAADGAALDAAGSGVVGSTLLDTYTTVSTTAVPGTTITGIVVDPGPDNAPFTPDDVASSVGNNTVYSSDTWKLPIAHAKVYLFGNEADAVFTDANGNFTLTKAPTGNVKVVIDGTTATNAPAGYYFPVMTLSIMVRAGVANTIPGAMGTPQQQAAMATDPAVYLPRVPTAALTTLSTTGMTTVTAPASSQTGLGTFPTSAQQLSTLSLTVAPNSVLDANGNVLANAQVGIAPVAPSIVQDMLPPGVLQHTFDLTIQAPGGAVFSTGATLTMPNVFNLAPGQKTYVLGFDHTTGQLVIQGTATASADGLTVTTDAGSGVVAPGWHGMTPPGSNGKGNLGGPNGNNNNNNNNNTLNNNRQQLRNNLKNFANNTNSAISNGSDVWTIGTGVIGAAGGNLAPIAHFGNGLSAGIDAASGLNNLGNNWDDVSRHGYTDPGAWAQLGFQAILDASNFALDIGGYIPGPAGRIASGARGVTAGIDYYQNNYAGDGSPAHQIQQNVDSSYGIYNVTSGGPSVAGAGAAENKTAATSTPFDAVLAAVQTEVAYELPIYKALLADYTILSALDVFDYTKPNLGVTTAQLQALGAQQTVLQAAMVDYYHELTLLEGHKTIPELSNEIIASATAIMNAAEAALYVPITQSYLSSAYGPQFLGARFGNAPASSGGNATASTTTGNTTNASATATQTAPVPVGQTTVYAAAETLDGAVQRFSFTASQGYSYFLSPNTYYLMSFYDPAANAIAQTEFTSGPSGKATNIPLAGLSIDTGTPGADGLTATEAFVIGVNNAKASNLVPGITDLAALQDGLYNGTVLPGTTGIVAALPLNGSAQAVAIAGALSTNQTAFAFVATGSYGLAIVDVSNPFTPTVVSQLKLSGNSTGIAVDLASGIAVVAAGSALHFVNVGIVTAPAVLQTAAAAATTVVIQSGIAYANSGSAIDAFDIATGTLLQVLGTGGSTITGLALQGTTLYSMDTAHTLRVFNLATGVITQTGALTLPAGGNGLTVANGVAYVAAGNQTFAGDYVTVDVSNPAAPKLIHGVDNAAIAGGALALNGSGIGLAVQAIQQGPPTPGVHNVVDLLNVSNTGNTGQLTTRFELPAAPFGVAIGAGEGFIADGTAGLQVVNYLAPDTTGIAPTIAISAPPTDVNAALTGTQVYEGEPISIGVTATDNVQVRSVALLVNGTIAANAVTFPFNLSTVMPTIAGNGGSTVTVQAQAMDTGGNIGLSAPVTLQLVPDTRPLQILGESVTEGSVLSQFTRSISVTFSKPVNPATVNASDITLVDLNGVAVPGQSLAMAANNQVVTLSFATLPIGTYHYTVAASGVRDFQGNALGSSVTTDFGIKQFTDIFTNLSGGNWNVAANWSTGVVPVAADSVYAGPFSGATVNYNAGTSSVAQLVTGGGGLFNVASGALTVTGLLETGGQLNVTGGGLSSTGGTLIDGNGAVSVQNRSTALNNLTIAPGANVSVTNNNVLNSAGTIVNNGTLALLSVANYTALTLTGATTLSGTGTVLLSDNSQNYINGGSTSTLTLASGTIAGGGTIGNDGLKLIVQAGGTIDATATNQLTINDPTAVTNAGLIEGTGPAPLLILNTSIANTGTIGALAAGSSVNLQSASITGGTLATANGGVIQAIDRGSVLDNVTIALNNAVHVTNNNFLSAADIFTNKGTVYLDSIANATELLALGSVTLTGGGVLQLSDNSQNYIDGGTLTALTNVNNTIQGAGTIGFSGVKIVNQAGGTINATAATNRLVIYDPLTPVINAGLIEDTGPAGLLILNTAINNSSTIGALVAGSHVDLQSASITGGTLATANGGVIQAIDRGSVLDNVTIALNNAVHVTNNNFLSAADIFTNKGTVYLDSVGNATELLTLGSVTLTGGGVLQLSDNSQNYIDGGTLTTLTNVNNTIRGAGTIGFSGMKIVNQIGGTINATATTNRLVIYDPATPVANAGLIEDTGPAGLLILNTTIDNTSTIGALVAGSHVDLQSAVINGGVLAMANGGVIDAVDRGSVLNNVSVSVGTGSALVVNNNQYLYLGGTLTNQGTVALNSLGNDTELRTIGTVTLNGGGVLALSDNGQNYLTSNGTAAVLINQNNTILGGGQIGDGGDALFALTNTATGLINATASNALRISMGGGTLTNNGLIESTSTAVNNGGLLVFNTVIDNTGNANGGVIRSNGVNSHVNLQSATIKGGTFQAINGGIIQEIDRGSTIDSVTVAAGSAIHVVNNTYLFVANTLTNLGTVFLDSQGNDTELLATGTVTLTGGGLLTLSDNSQNYLNGSGATLLNVNNTIAGSGTIFGGLIFTNQSAGIVNATGAANRLVIGNTVPVTNAGLLEDTGAAGLGLVNTTVNNTGTIGAFGAGSHVDLQSATINGGILATMGGGVIQELDRGSVLNGVTVAAGATVNTVNNAFLYLQGTITNRGTIGVNSGGNDTELVSSGSVTLTGGGTVLLSDTGQNFLSSTASATLINANNTIAGAGTIGLNGLTFTNQAAGTINGTGTSRLVIADTVPVTNAGLIEATGAGGIGIFSATVNNTGTIEALLAGTHVDLASATINGGVLATSSTGVIQAIDRGVTLNSVTIAAGSLVNVTNNNFMFLQGTISNLGTIGLSSGGNDTRLRLVGSVVIGGGGTIALSNTSVNLIDSAVANTTLNLTAGTLQGTGTLGDANMTVVTGSAGTIVGSGLTVTTGANTLSNSGLLESLSGGLTVNETVANNGSIWANGGGLYIAGNITGTGAERITGAQTLRIGGSVASGQTVTFDSGSTGVLRLDNSQNFAGTVVGLANAANLSALDLSDIGFISGTTKATYAGTTAGGTLSVTDGTHTAKILLTGNYTAGSFLTSSDGHSGTTVVDPPGPAIAGLLGPSGALSPMDFLPAASVAAPMPAAGTSSTGGATDPMAPMMIPPIGAHGGGAIG